MTESVESSAVSEVDGGKDPIPGSKHELPVHLKYLTLLFFMPLMAVATAAFGCISLLCGLWDKSGRQQHAIAHMWAKTMLVIACSPVEVIGREKLGAQPVALYASNHLSYMDTPVLFAKLPFQFRILARSALWKIPFIGWYLGRSGQVPIDSRNSRSTVAGLLKGVATLKAGLPLMVFPEGGRALDGHLQSAASGCAFMAIRAGVPIVPVALVGTYELLPMHVYSLRPRVLKIVIGDAIPTDGLGTRDADQLTERMLAAIREMYYRHSEMEPRGERMLKEQA
jgi:1-acyl-sn-glycerol-3-phosphate acyltransferase